MIQMIHMKDGMLQYILLETALVNIQGMTQIKYVLPPTSKEVCRNGGARL